MKLCTRCDTDESVGIHLVLRKDGKEIGHICRDKRRRGKLWSGVEIENGEIHATDLELVR